MLTSINLTNNFQDNKIQLSIPLKLSTQKIEGRDMTKAEREMYRDLLIEHVQKEGIDLDGEQRILELIRHFFNVSHIQQERSF